MDAIPHSTKEQHPVLKEDSLEWENNNPETEKKENLKTLICPTSLKNGSEHSIVYHPPLANASDRT